MSVYCYNKHADTVSVYFEKGSGMLMIKGTPELIGERQEEILNVCERLYQTMHFKDVTIKEIGKETTFSRPTIYNYFESKEEIFLGLFEREYVKWTAELEEICQEATGLSREELAEKIAGSLEKRKLLLKLLAVNLYDMEENSRMERLVSFKTAYGKSREALAELIHATYPNLTEAEVRSFVFRVLPYLHGVYPYAFATEKQIEAMDQIHLAHPETTIRELVRNVLLRLLPIKQ